MIASIIGRLARFPGAFAGRNLHYLFYLVIFVTVLDMATTPTHGRFIFFGHFLFNAIPAVLLFSVAPAAGIEPATC